MTMLEESQTLDARVRERLEQVREQLFRPLGVEGVYARSALYEGLSERLDAFITRLRDPAAEVLRFPPVMSRRQLERSGYLGSFPNLLGCVCALHGTEQQIRAAAEAREQGGDWTESLGATDLVLSPAACYPLYPLVAARGAVPIAGALFDVAADCFRHEPSHELSRLQSFRMRELVYIGVPEQVVGFRERWMQRGAQLARQLGLPTQIEVASDPFFGRIGQVMAVSQLQQALKFELLIPYHDAAPPTACMSFNYHREHFSDVWGFKSAAGEPIHTACVAFGMDRLVVAMFCVHGVELARWPDGVRRALAL